MLTFYGKSSLGLWYSYSYVHKIDFKKYRGIATKSKEISIQLKPVRNGFVTMMHHPVTPNSNTCSQMYAQMKHFLAHLQDSIPTLGGMNICIYIYIYIYIYI